MELFCNSGLKINILFFSPLPCLFLFNHYPTGLGFLLDEICAVQTVNFTLLIHLSQVPRHLQVPLSFYHPEATTWGSRALLLLLTDPLLMLTSTTNKHSSVTWKPPQRGLYSLSAKTTGPKKLKQNKKAGKTTTNKPLARLCWFWYPAPKPQHGISVEQKEVADRRMSKTEGHFIAKWDLDGH